jgi:hypothetical protein
VTQSTILSSGPINGADTLTIEVVQPHSMPAVVRIVWPSAATITTPAHYLEVASAAMRLLAEASTTLGPNPSEPTALTTWSARSACWHDHPCDMESVEAGDPRCPSTHGHVLDALVKTRPLHPHARPSTGKAAKYSQALSGPLAY